MGRFRVLPYKQGSRSAKALADALGGKVLKLVGSTFKPKTDDVVINWGNSAWLPPEASWKVLNHAYVLPGITNKLSFFQLMTEKGLENDIPRFWTDQDSIPDDAFPVVCRTVLSGHSGAGIVLAPTRADVVEAPLYTQYVKKKDEYRIHLGMRNGVIQTVSVQRKATRVGFENPNYQIRNHSNGFVFVRNDVNPPEAVLDACRRVFEASGLDFGAVDVGYNNHTGKATVYEINTAPGLEGQTIEDYADFFRGLA